MTIKKGDRVKRGPTWEWDAQDCEGENPQAPQTIGTATGDEEEDGWITIKWDGGGSYKYPVNDPDDSSKQDIVLVSGITWLKNVYSPGCQHPRKRKSFIGPMIGMIMYCPDCKQEI